ncbi:MAG: spermidine/putrescine ABC transporter substrate-binding protein [Eubacteriales bacterium]|nr:spermidine/putrescine ABC transporter substrate-binding protein [Eubacteriales bacterium]
MKKIMALILCLCLSALPLLGLAEEEKVVNILSWEGYVDEDTLNAFTEETGIKVVWSPMESIDEMLLKISQSGGEGYDLILTSDYSLDILRQEGLIQKLDKSKFTNYGNLNPTYMSQFYDPENEYVIPYVSGCTLIVYDPEKVPFEITGYEDLWNEALQDSIGTLDLDRVIIGVTLKSMGYSMNETDPEILAQAKEKLMPLYKNIRAFGDTESYAALVSGEASVGFIYASFASLLQTDAPQFQVVYPKEGIGFGIDGFVLTAASKHVDSAHAFLDYIMNPEVAAHNAEYQGYTNVNKAAEEYLSDAYWSNPAVCIPDDVMKGSEIVQDVGEAQSIYTDIYTAFKLQ